MSEEFPERLTADKDGDLRFDDDVMAAIVLGRVSDALGYELARRWNAHAALLAALHLARQVHADIAQIGELDQDAARIEVSFDRQQLAALRDTLAAIDATIDEAESKP